MTADIDLSITLPKEKPFYYSRIVENHLFGVPEFADIAITGEVLLPVPIAPVGTAVLRHRDISPRPYDGNDTADLWGDRLGGRYDEVVCRPIKFNYQRICVRDMWDRERYRDFIEKDTRRMLAEAVAEHFPIVFSSRIHRY